MSTHRSASYLSRTFSDSGAISQVCNPPLHPQQHHSNCATAIVTATAIAANAIAPYSPSNYFYHHIQGGVFYTLYRIIFCIIWFPLGFPILIMRLFAIIFFMKGLACLPVSVSKVSLID